MRSERSLMLATEGENPEEISRAVINTLNDHINTEGISAEDLPQAEAELLLLNMRAKSVGEKISIRITDPELKGVSYPVNIDLTDIQVVVDKDFKDTIKLNDETTIIDLPGLTSLDLIDDQEDDFNMTIQMLASCIRCLVIDDETHTKCDAAKSEFVKFLLDLDAGSFQQITDQFFTKLPKLFHTVTVTKKNEETMDYEVVGLASFL